MIFFKKVYKTNKIDFFFLVGLLGFYALLHPLKLSVTPLHLYAMFSLKEKKEVRQSIAHKLFVDGKPIDVSDFNKRKEQYLLKTYHVYDRFHKGGGHKPNKVYNIIHDKLPFLKNQKQYDRLYKQPDYQEKMTHWAQEYFNCKSCEIELYRYNIEMKDDFSVVATDSIKIL